MLALKDRVKELTTTTGTGTLTLVSAPTGYRRFSAVFSNADTTYYCIESGSQWEVGIGTYSANTLARTTVLASSNSNSLIDIVAARSFVFVTYAADKAVYKDGSNRAVMGAGGLIFSDASVQTTAATSPDLSPYLTTSTAASTYLPLAGGTLTGDLKFTDALYDIGKSGATRPRDGYFSRNVTVDKLSLGGQSIVGHINIPNFQWINWGGTNLLAGSSSLGLGVNGVPLYGISDLSARAISAVNGTTATSLIVHETYTSATSFGGFRVRANAGAAYQIGSAVGSAGGSNRAIDLGRWDSAGTWQSSLLIDPTNFLVTVGSTQTLLAKYIQLTSLGQIRGDSGNITLTDHSSATYFGLLRFGGTSSSYPAIKRNGVGLEFRLADDSAVAGITAGALTLTQAVSTSGSPTAFTITGAAHTTLTTAEVTDGYFNAARTVNFGATGGTIASQRTWRFTAPTFTATAATTLTTMSTVSISGPPVASTNVTGTNAYALNVESGPSNFAGKITAPATGQRSTGGIGNGNNGIDFFGGVLCYFANGYPVYFCDSSGSPRLKLSSSCLFGFGNSADAGADAVIDTPFARRSAGFAVLRNSTTAQAFGVYGTYTSDTSYELINLKGKASANFEIGPENGSAGGTLRGLTIGCYPAGTSTIVGWAQFRPNASTGILEAFYLGPIADSTATGGNARGTNSVDLQMVRSAANQVASGLGAIAIGRYSIASGNGSIALGESNTSSGLYTVAIGYGASASGFGAIATGAATCSAGYGIAIGGRDNVSNGNYSVAIGNFVTSSGVYSVAFQQCVASGDYSWAYGLQANADRPLMAAYAGGRFSVNGDAQQVKWVLRNKTTNNTATNILVGGSTRLTIPSGKTMSGFLIVKGIKSDGSAKARFVRLCDITNVGGTTTLDTPIEAIGTDYNPSACVLAVTAEDATDDLQVNITGPAGETWRWTATFSGLEIAYGT